MTAQGLLGVILFPDELIRSPRQQALWDLLAKLRYSPSDLETSSRYC